jgi:hypothetical protein
MVDSGLTPNQNRLPPGITHIQHPQSQSDGLGCVTAYANKEPGQNMDIITGMDRDTQQQDQNIGSPIEMDQATQQQGQELQEVLKMFKQAHSSPLSSCILKTPQHKRLAILAQTQMSDQHADLKTKSTRLKGKTSSGKIVVRMAQDLIAKKWGITPPDRSLDDMTLKQYLEVYKKPLSETAMNVVSKLAEVEVNKKKIKGRRKESKGNKGKKEVKLAGRKVREQGIQGGNFHNQTREAERSEEEQDQNGHKEVGCL